MARKQIRKWFVVSEIYGGEPVYFVSAFSDIAVHTWLQKTFVRYRVMPAQVYHLLKVMSGKPQCYITNNRAAPNVWRMDRDGISCQVVILN